MKIEKNIQLKKYTTYRIGGPADFFINAKTEEDIISAIDWVNSKKIPFVILGNGSNILVNDKGFRGLVIKISYLDCQGEDDKIACGAGAMLPAISNFARQLSLSGAEFMSAIPGTLGGAIVGNAGTGNDMETKGLLESAKIIEENANIRNVGPDYFDFSYRNSKLKESGDVVIEATLKLEPGDKKEIKEKIEKMAKKRQNQPRNNSAGSVFRNPENQKAGELIEKTELKGKKVGGAVISEEHANFILNKSNATSEDVETLIRLAQKEVKDKFNIKLEREIRILTEQGWE